MQSTAHEVFWHHLADIAQIAGGFATVVGVFVTALAATLVLFQINASGRLAQEAYAMEKHRNYINLCIQYPEFSSSEILKKHLKITSFEGIESRVEPETERALWFLSHVLNTCEGILETSKDREWHAVVRSQLSYHDETLREVWSRWRKHYSIQLRSVVENEILPSRNLIQINRV